MPRKNKVQIDGIGYEIKGKSYPPYNRRNLRKEKNDIDLDIPNGDIVKGQRIFRDQCQGCHDLDHDFSLGPEIRTSYLRKAGSRKKFQLYSYGMRTSPIYWTKRKLWEFLEDPEKMYPDTSMSFDGIKDPQTMAAIIEYMHYLRVETITVENSKRYII